MNTPSFALAVVLLSCRTVLGAEPGPAADVKVTPLDDRVRVEVDGKPFTEYHFRGATRPYCYPVLAPDGLSLTREFPMKSPPGESHDHPHQRALWFAHGNVNGVDFWNEGANVGTRFPKGTIEHATLVETAGGPGGLIHARNRWLGPEGKLVCTDDTVLRFRGTPDTRVIDFEVTLHALPDTPLVLGDNKDGSMAIRVAQWMTLPGQANRQFPGHGHFVAANGERDDDAWGKRNDWCDLFAEHDGKIYGVALFDHPQNPHHPTWWMARGYGLFAANPFAHNDIENLKQPGLGSITVPAGGRARKSVV